MRAHRPRPVPLRVAVALLLLPATLAAKENLDPLREIAVASADADIAWAYKLASEDLRADSGQLDWIREYAERNAA